MNNIYINEFLTEYDYPADACAALKSAFKSICESDVLSCEFEKAYDSYKSDSSYKNLESILESLEEKESLVSIHPYTVEFLLYVVLSEHLYTLYEENGYSRQMCKAAIYDLKYKLIECYDVHGIWGTEFAHWFIGFFALTRFSLGRLQFQMDTLPKGSSPDGKYSFCGNEEAIFVHIPSSGPLNIDEVHKSFKTAASFFADNFDGPEVIFATHSWLLYPAHRPYLSPESNIIKFMDEFTVIKVEPDENGGDLWRIFNTTEKDITKLPQKTSLQRAYVKMMSDGIVPGVAVGIKYMKKQDVYEVNPKV